MPLKLLFRLLLAEAGMLILALAQPLTGEMLNAQGNATTRKEAPSIAPEYVSLGKTAAEVTPEETTAPARAIKKTGHGLNTGDFVVLTELNGKTTLGETAGGLFVGFGYWVRKVDANNFELAYTKAQAESATAGEHIEWTVTIKATSKFAKIEEGAVTARIKVTWAAGANLLNEDATAREVEATGSYEVKWLLYYSALTVGTLCLCEAATPKSVASGDLYKVTKSQLAQTGFIA